MGRWLNLVFEKIGLKILGFWQRIPSHTHAFCIHCSNALRSISKLGLQFFFKTVFFPKFSVFFPFSIDPACFSIDRKSASESAKTSVTFDRSNVIFDRSNIVNMLFKKGKSDFFKVQTFSKTFLFSLSDEASQFLQVFVVFFRSFCKISLSSSWYVLNTLAFQFIYLISCIFHAF